MAQQIERRFINEYLHEKFSDKHYQTRVWLGPAQPGKEANEYMVVGKWADAILFEPQQITIIETKLEPVATAIGQLEMYEQEFPKTLRFQQYWNTPIKKSLVTTRVDESVQDVCKLHNIEYVVYHPDWISFWEKRRFRI